jgi:alpha-mannosidase
MEAEDLNRPLLALPCRAGAEVRVRPLAVDGVSLGLAALKQRESGADGSLVLRLYEPQGARGAARLTLPEGWKAAASLNLLEEGVGEPDLGFLPFQVRTHLLTPVGGA